MKPVKNKETAAAVQFERFLFGAAPFRGKRRGYCGVLAGKFSLFCFFFYDVLSQDPEREVVCHMKRRRRAKG